MEEQNTPYQNPDFSANQLNKKNTLIIVLLVILALITSGIAGYAFYQNYQLKKQITQLREHTLEEPTTSKQLSPFPESNIPTGTESTPTTNPTENWKTYSNNDLFFKYPPSWNVQKQHNNRIVSANSKIIINVATTDTTLMNECMKLDKVEDRNTFVIKHFSGATTGEMCSANNFTSREKWIIPNKNAYSPGISYSYTTDESPEAERVFNLILSTFKFIDSSSKQTTQQIISTVENYLSGNPGTPIIKEPELFYDNIYTVSYSYENNPGGAVVLVGKINGEWKVAEGETLCAWIKNSDADEATKAYLGPSCNF